MLVCHITGLTANVIESLLWLAHPVRLLGPPLVEYQADLQWEHSMAVLHGQSLLIAAGLLYIASLFVKAAGVVLFYYFLSHLLEILIAETSASFTTVHQPSSRSLTVSLMRCASPPPVSLQKVCLFLLLPDFPKLLSCSP